VCRELQEDPPCGICVPDIFPENKDALEVFFLVEDQVITAGMSGKVISLSLPAIKVAMDICNIRNQRDCARRVKRAFSFLLEEQG
jgi:hypothetical protein